MRVGGLAQRSRTLRMMICVITGFTSGLPLFLLLNMVPAWLKLEGVSLATIGAMSLAQVPYTWKFIWAPLLDRYSLPILGRRRSWIVIGATSIAFVIVILGTQNPARNMNSVFLICLLLAFCSATLDIALDAYRRELLPDVELGLGNAIHVNAYRVAGLVPGALGLALAAVLPWSTVFWINAAFMSPALLLVIFMKEPMYAKEPQSLRLAMSEPFREFLHRQGWQRALLILSFIFFYKLGDSLCTSLATPFYLSSGFSLTDIAFIAKNAGLWPSVLGGLLGGMWMLRMGIRSSLLVFGIAQAVPILGFWLLAQAGPFPVIDTQARVFLGLVVGVEAFGVGLGTTAFVAYIASIIHPSHTATQLALLTSLAALPRTFINAFAGWIVEFLGWEYFFIFCFVLALPGFLLLFRLMRRQ